jgi:arylsulfatase A-like enzyme
MKDIVLVTADSIRFDGLSAMPTVEGFDTKLGITGGHYTRPSLASLLSASHEAAVRSRAVEPTLATVLADNGYTCIGFAPTPQTDEKFGFDAGFHTYENFFDPGSRGSRRRNILSEITILRRIYHRFFPPHAKLDDLPTDEAVISQAIEAFNDADGPRFLWVHLMESHRPYGRGSDSVPQSIDGKALFSPDKLTADEREEIQEKYTAALERVDNTIETLLSGLETDDPIVTFASDHGDEFGEEGYYFHQPQRRRVARKLVEVPVGFDGVEVPGDRLCLLDIPPTLVDSQGIDVPDSWHGHSLFAEDRSQTLTVAPWNSKATVLWQDFETRVVATDGAVSIETGGDQIGPDDDEIPEELQEQLRDLGYVG